MDRGIVTDILKMLIDGSGNGNLHLRDAQRLHERGSIVVGTIAGTEAWHGDTDYSFTIQSQFVECAHANQQSQRRVQSTADAQYDVLAVGVQQSLGQCRCLDVQYLLTGVAHLLVRRNERVWVDLTGQLERLAKGSLCRNMFSMGTTLRIDERRVGITLGAQALHINLCALQLGLEREAVALNEQSAILENHGVATIDDVLCRLAKATRCIDIATHGARTLLGNQRAQVAMLTNELVAGREVDNDVSTRHRQVVAGWNGCPDVLTDLYAKLHVAHLEELGFGRERDRRASQIDTGGVQVLRRGKPALLIEFAIVGQVGLWNHTQQRAALDDSSTVEQQSTSLYGQSHHADNVELAREVEEAQQPLFGLRD